jgi:hypothetical protein
LENNRLEDMNYILHAQDITCIMFSTPTLSMYPTNALHMYWTSLCSPIMSMACTNTLPLEQPNIMFNNGHCVTLSQPS